MKGLRRHPFRVVGRLVWFGFEMIQAVCVYWLRCVLCPKASRRSARARWLQRTARHVGRIFQLEIRAGGKLPATGLLICNHVSYVDILVLVSLAPAMFVAKREVRSWPVMGLMAQLGGTLFIDRQRRTHVGQINDDIQAALDDGALVIVFPEGTSSDGKSVLPFKSSLLEPATQQKHPLTVGRVHYSLANGDADGAVAYWGDAVFFTHLLNLLSRDKVRAAIRFAPVPDHSSGRKELARQLQAAVSELKIDSSA
jgi:lyso-ornithine lipid O-acyltransferase